MAFEEGLRSLTFDAGADLSSSQYRGVKLNATGQVIRTAADHTDEPTGILQNAPNKAGERATVAVGGISKMEAEATSIAIGDNVSCSDDGRALDAGTTADRQRIGIAMTASAAAGTIISVLIDKREL